MSRPSGRVCCRFGNFELDAAAYELRRGGIRVRLARQPMDLLLLLVERPGELVSRDEIVRVLWPEHVFVDTDAGIHTAVLRVRQALAVDGGPSLVETVSGKGYRFVGQVNRVVSPSAHVPPATHDDRSARRHNLPSDLTSFIGRDQELAELPRLLANTRLLSLLGSGGVGKTRLAVRLASRLVESIPDGIWMADLGAVSERDLVVETIALVLGLRESPHRSPRSALLDYLRGRSTLIVLDTCEHLVGTCADVVEMLLHEAPGLRILATSREALGVPGEVIYRVPSLSVPDSTASIDTVLESDAGRLFLDRARAADPAFELSTRNAAAVARICRRLDGIPLAIELAAARVGMLAPEELEPRLEDRFRLLTGARTAVARHRTLEATVEWSFQLLTDRERLLLNRLSVFPASWTLEAVEQVCSDEAVQASDMPDLLSRLVNKSLVVIERGTEGRFRYRLLDSVRDYAKARIAEHGGITAWRERHFKYVFDRFRGSQPVLRGADQQSRLDQLRVEQENVRAALDWAFDPSGAAACGAELAAALFWFWTKQSLFEEGRRWLQQAVDVPAAPRVRARALIGLAHMYHFQGDQTRVAGLGAEAMCVGRESGDEWAVSVGHFLQALASFELGDLDRARANALLALTGADACGDLIERGGPLMILANVALARGNQDEALRLYDESIDVHRRAGDAWGLSILLSIAAGLRIVRDDFDRARLHALEALSLCQALEDPRGLAWCLEVFAGLLAAGGNQDDATRLWGLSDALRETSGGALTATIGWIRDRYLPPAAHSMGDWFFIVREEGTRMSVADAAALIGVSN